MFPRPLHCAGSWARGGAPSRSPSRYYTEGVYQSGPSSPGTDGWQRVDHAVLLVGWGEEKGVKCAPAAELCSRGESAASSPGVLGRSKALF